MEPSEGRVRTGERKLVTALFCDLVGSTALAERLDPEVLEAVTSAYFERMSSLLEEHGGAVEKFAGDAVVAVFGVPQSHEDDPLRAVRCGLAMRAALPGLNEMLRARLGVELMLRIGVATGEAFAGRGDGALATGDVMNTAARIEQAAAPGEVLAGRETMLLTRERVDYAGPRLVEAKGKSERLEVWAARKLVTPRRRHRSEVVGRERELEQLEAALRRAVQEREAQFVTVLGEPGIGKTRLAEEFTARARDRARVYTGACLSYGEGTTWLPFAQIVRAAAGIEDGDGDDVAIGKLRRLVLRLEPGEEAALLEAQLAPLVGASTSHASKESELRWGLRRFVERVAEESPTVLVVDDVHWAVTELLELLGDLAADPPPVPLVLVCQGRPEARESLAALLAGARSTVLELEALSGRDARRLAAGLSDGEVSEDLVSRGGGNPLFIEELVAISTDEGVARDSVPNSVRSLIAARLDLLPPPAKLAAQSAAVLGDIFWDSDLVELVERNGSDLAETLEILRARGLVDEQASSLAGARQFRFHHALIREVAYGSLAKRSRARLHSLAATWLSGRVADRADLILAVAYHFDTALTATAEIAPLEPVDPVLRRAAVEALIRGGEWARRTAALSEAVRLLRRSVEAAAGDHELEDAAGARLAVALVRVGSRAEAVKAATRVLERSPCTASGAFAEQALAEAARDEGDAAGTLRHGHVALELAREHGLTIVQAEVLLLMVWANFWVGEIRAAEAAGQEAMNLALDKDDSALAAALIAFGSALSAMWLGAVERGEQHALRAFELARRAPTPSALAACNAVLGHVRRMQDRLDEAVELGRERLRLCLEIGERFQAASSAALSLGDPLIDAGRLEEAWAALADGLEIAREIGSVGVEGPIRLRRARILTVWGRLEEAEAELEAVRPAKGMGADDWSGALAELRAAQHRDREAEEIWRELLGRLPEQQVLDLAELRLPFAAFLVDRGRQSEAKAVLDEIRRLVEGTGAALLIRQLEALETRISSATGRGA